MMMNKVKQTDTYNPKEELKRFLAKPVKEKEAEVQKLIVENHKLRRGYKKLYLSFIKLSNFAFSQVLAAPEDLAAQLLSSGTDDNYIDNSIKKMQGLIKKSEKTHPFTKKQSLKPMNVSASPKKSIDQSMVTTNTTNQMNKSKYQQQATLINMSMSTNRFESIQNSTLTQKKQTISISQHNITLKQLAKTKQQNIKLSNQVNNLNQKITKLKKLTKQFKNDLYIVKVNKINDLRKQLSKISQLIKSQQNKYLSIIQQNIQANQLCISQNSYNIQKNLIQRLKKQAQKVKNEISLSNLQNFKDIQQKSQFIKELLSVVIQKLQQQLKQLLTQLIKKVTVTPSTNKQLSLRKQKSKKQPQLKYQTIEQLKYELQSKIHILKQESSLNSRQVIIRNPKLCFMVSNILPIMWHNTHQHKYQWIDQTQQFILDSITNFYNKGKKIIGLKLLYSFKQHNRKINFHRMIDNHPNLLLIVKLKHCQSIVGVYSQRGLIQEEGESATNKNVGFIFDSMTKKVYPPRQKFENSYVMPYNQYYLIAGNHDLKIRFDSEEIQSCFGTQTSMFRPNSSYTVDKILHNGAEHATALTDYQLYHVMLV